jgi:hypothetical protein
MTGHLHTETVTQPIPLQSPASRKDGDPTP